MLYDIPIKPVGKKVYRKLAWLNELPVDEAEYVFMECSGSKTWSRQMAASRPYPMLSQLFDSASIVWASLDADERAAACDGRTTPDEKLKLVLQRLTQLLER